MIKDHFPYAVAALFLALVCSGFLSLSILVVAFALAVVPIVYAREVNDLGVGDDDRTRK